jgi:hypothetical protein
MPTASPSTSWSQEQRGEFTSALAKRMAEAIEDNADMLLASTEPGACRRHFLEVFNAAGADYADYGCDEKGPDFGFRRAYAARVREGMPEKDRSWVYDQVMEIEAPEGVQAIRKTLDGLFGGEGKPARRAREGTLGRMRPRPFDLDNAPPTPPGASASWPAIRAAGRPAGRIADPRRLTLAEREALLARCAVANMALYASRTGSDPDKDIPRLLGRQLGLVNLDANRLADDDGISPLAVAPAGTRTEFIPYTDRGIKWHTDGYYNTSSARCAACCCIACSAPNPAARIG